MQASSLLQVRSSAGAPAEPRPGWIHAHHRWSQLAHDARGAASSTHHSVHMPFPACHTRTWGLPTCHGSWQSLPTCWPQPTAPPSPTHTYTYTHPPRPQPPYLAASPQVVSVQVVPGKHAILATASGKLYQADAAGLFELTGNNTDSADVDIWAIGQGLVFSPVSCVWALGNYCVNNAARKLFDSTCQGQDPTWAAPNCELRCVSMNCGNPILVAS